MPDVMVRLMRLRAAQTDTARRDLASALRAHDVSGAQLAASHAALTHEARAISGDPAHPLSFAYAAWLPHGQANIGRAQADQAATGQGLAMARSALAETRIALRACESVAENQSASRRKDALQRAQLALDDSIRRPASSLAMAAETG